MIVNQHLNPFYKRRASHFFYIVNIFLISTIPVYSAEQNQIPTRFVPYQTYGAKDFDEQAHRAIEIDIVLIDHSATNGFEPYFDSVGIVKRHVSHKKYMIELRKEESYKIFRENRVIHGRPFFNYELYLRRLKKFPSVRHCLMKSERQLKQPDLTQIDWSTIEHIEDAYICYSLIFYSYKSALEIVKWLSYQGYAVSAGSSSDEFTEYMGVTDTYVINAGIYSPPPFKVQHLDLREWLRYNSGNKRHTLSVYLSNSAKRMEIVMRFGSLK